MAKTPKSAVRKQPDPKPRGIIERIDPRLLKPNFDNSRRRIDPAKVTELAASMRTAGVVQPIMVDPDNMVVLGERRRRAALEAGLSEVPVYRIPVLAPQEQLLLQAVENLQRVDYSEAELKALVPYLLVLERQGLLGPDPRSVSEETPTRRRELGVRSLAARLGKSPKWVSTYSGVKDVPKKLRPLVTDGKLSRKAALDIQARCPTEHREQLTKRVGAIAPAGFVETGAVEAVLDGLEAAGGNADVVHDVLNCLTVRAESKTTRADVQTALSKVPELKLEAEVRDARRLADVMHALRRRLTPECAARLGTFSNVSVAAEQLQNTLSEWRRAAIRASAPSRPEPAPTPLQPLPEPTDFLVTADLSEAERLVLEVIIARLHLLGKLTWGVRLAQALPTLSFNQIITALRHLTDLGVVHVRGDDGAADDEDQQYYIMKTQRIIFGEDACVSLARCRREHLDL